MRTGSGRRAAAAWALASAAALGLGACSNAGAGGTAGDGAECKEFTYWSMWKEGEAMQTVMAQAIADFEEETGATVDVQWQGRDNVQRVVPTLNTNTVPDLIDSSYVKLYPALVATGQALGLEEAWNSDVDGKTVGEVVPSQYVESIDLELEDGQPWMVPYTLTSDAIWFNAAEYPELVDNPPETWEDYIALLDQLKSEGVTPIASDGDIPGYNAYWLSTLILRASGPGSLYATAEDTSGEAWSNEVVVDAAEKVQQLVDGGYFIKGYTGSKFPTQQQRWAAGEAALLFMGTWAPTETKPYAADGFEYASFPFPTLGDFDSARADFNGFAVPKNAQCAGLAQQFAAHYLDTNYQKMAAEAGMLPMREDVEPPAEQRAVWEHLREAGSFHQQNDGVAFPGYNDKVFWSINDDLVLGKINAKEFVSQMTQTSADYWEQQGS